MMTSRFVYLRFLWLTAALTVVGCGGSGGGGASGNPGTGGTPPPVNQAPVAGDDEATLAEDENIVIPVLDNDSDSDGQLAAGSVLISAEPEHGTATIDADGQVSYTPEPNYSGADSFRYTVADNQALRSGAATVSITVTPVNDVPVARDDNATVAEDDSALIAVTDNDDDIEGLLNPSSVSIVTPPVNGVAAVEADGRIRYEPAADFNGVDELGYTVADSDDLASATATVSIVVTPVNDVPVAANDQITINQYQSIRFDPTTNDSFPDGRPACSLLAGDIGTPTTGAALVIDGCRIEYFPDLGVAGVDSFTYAVVDADGDVAQGQVDVTITDDGEPFAVHERDNVARLSIEGTSFLPGGASSTQRIQGWTNTVMSYVRDDFDFVVFVQNCTTCAGASGLFYDVRNDVAGLGKPIFDDGAIWGSADALTGVIYLRDRTGVKFGPSLHEILHNWAVHFRPPNGDDIPASHWGVVGTPGQLGGFDPATLVDLGAGQYQATSGVPGATSFGVNANGGNSLPYSQHELYLMGFASPASVPPLMVPANPVPVDFANGVFSADALDEQTIDDIVAAAGPRVPDSGAAQTDFKVLFVLLSTYIPKGEDPELEVVADHVDWLSFPGVDAEPDAYNFYEATNGVGMLEAGNLQQSLIN